MDYTYTSKKTTSYIDVDNNDECYNKDCLVFKRGENFKHPNCQNCSYYVGKSKISTEYSNKYYSTKNYHTNYIIRKPTLKWSTIVTVICVSLSIILFFILLHFILTVGI